MEVCVENGPTAEVLAELVEKDAEIMASGIIFKPDKKYLLTPVSDEYFRKLIER